jgi:RNA polymerase sigma-70 factor (ECF subfamily)
LQSEKELIARIKSNPQDFEIIYNEYFDRIFGYIVKRTLDYDLAKDICSEVFLKAFLSVQKFKWTNTPLIIWLFKIAQNEIRQYFRNKKYKPEHLSANLYPFKNQTSPSAEQEKIELDNQLVKSKRIQELIGSLNKLSEKQRECISLKFIENFTYDEISLVLCMKTGTVKSHISRGLEKLRKMQPF